MAFLKKAGNGFVLVGYPASNPAAKAASMASIESQEGNNVMYVPVNDRDGQTIDKVVTHVPVHMTGAQMQWTVVTGINEMIKSCILGESLTTQSANTGLGSNLGEQHGITADDRTKYFAQDLEFPLQKLVNILNKKNCPFNPPPKYKLLADKRNPAEVMDAVDKAMSWGIAVPQAWVQDQLGIPTPIGNEPTLAVIQPMQATAVGATPSGTPMVGPAGPTPQGAGGGGNPQGQLAPPPAPPVPPRIQQ